MQQEFRYNDLYKILHPIAYRITGNKEDAGDLVQDTLLSILDKKTDAIENLKGYLVKSVINRSLNFIRRKKQRENIPIAPELLLDFIPALIENSDSVSLSLLLIMERLSPLERAVFLLREIFGYSYKELAALLDISEAYARQILSRARKNLKLNRARFTVNHEHHEEVYESFIRVCQGEDLAELITILREDVALYENNGPVASARGSYPVSAYINRLKAGLPAEATLRLMLKEGLPALVAYLWEQPIWEIRLSHQKGRITAIHLQRNTSGNGVHTGLSPLREYARHPG